MKGRRANDPTRRFADPPPPRDVLERLAEAAVYVGSGHHKLHPRDYGLERTNPRGDKTLCDAAASIGLAEARELLRTGIRRGMISDLGWMEWPKYVWSVDDASSVAFEAKCDPRSASGMFHGYPLIGDLWHETVLKEWKRRG